MPLAQSQSIDDRNNWSGRNIGAALGPPESAAPISAPTVPEVGASNFYIDLWPLGGRKSITVTNFRKLLPSGHTNWLVSK